MKVTRASSAAAVAALLSAVLGCGSSEPTGPTGLESPAAASVPTPVPPNFPASTTPTPGPNPPVLKLRTNPDPPAGTVPFDVNFNACKSFDPDGDKLVFTYDFGDGKVKQLNFCRDDHFYKSTGRFVATVCASDGRTRVCASVVVDAS